MDKTLKWLNQWLKKIGVSVCHSKIRDKFFIFYKTLSPKKYSGDFSVGCYVGLPKCAHSSVSQLAKQTFDCRWMSPDHPSPEFPWFFCSDHHLGTLESAKRTSKLSEFERAELSIDLDLEDLEVYKNIYFFTVVRNPYSWIHGAWQECKEMYEINLSFKDFLLMVKGIHDKGFDPSDVNGEDGISIMRARWHFRPQLESLLSEKNKISVHSIIKIEDLEAGLRGSLSGFSTFYGEAFLVPWTNTKPHGESHKRLGKGYREFYNEETRKLVESMYWSDIDFFDYEY